MISYVENSLNQKVNDYLSLKLLDHINYALKRAERGQFVRSPLTWEVKKFYPKHFEFGIYALRAIEEEYDVNFPEDEAVSIALHFVNLKETKNNLKAAVEVMETLRRRTACGTFLVGSCFFNQRPHRGRGSCFDLGVCSRSRR
ncbi:PRD domain-containing protein [Paenibacillus anaericanus]|uniref:PRD domain-containing protein n=1 Tax=Paenibacillus anaericanus TaxID=170367 RepID=A0A3S1BIK3_9BACL|nr:PRD domain-containing protein [Paenibacillus anaericanus]